MTMTIKEALERAEIWRVYRLERRVDDENEEGGTFRSLWKMAEAENATLKAEVERLTDMLRAARETVLETRQTITENIKVMEKAEAELAKRKPLIEAVEKAPIEDLESCISIYGQDLNPDPALDIIRAALLYKEQSRQIKAGGTESACRAVGAGQSEIAMRPAEGSTPSPGSPEGSYTIWTRERLEELTDFWNDIWDRLHPAGMDSDEASPKEEKCWGDLLDILNDWGDRLCHPPAPSPGSAEDERALENLEDWIGALKHGGYPITETDKETLTHLRSRLAKPAPPEPKVVTRGAFDSACEKFAGHWAGTLDDIKGLGKSILEELGVEVEGEKP